MSLEKMPSKEDITKSSFLSLASSSLDLKCFCGLDMYKAY
jgi:hypothetical protein